VAALVGVCCRTRIFIHYRGESDRGWRNERLNQSENAVWTYELPHEAVAGIRDYLAFYPSRVDGIEVIS